VLAGSNATIEAIDRDPLFRQQFFNRTYVHFEQSLTWDRRDNPTQARRGFVLMLSLAEGTRSPVSDYTFLRTQFEARGYVPLRNDLTVALRGVFGAIVGSSVYESSQRRWYWPVPPELRFYSGGTQSNRGYPFNRVGLLGAASQRPFGATPASDDPSRYVAIGGTAMWETSIELRWQPGAFGLVAFLDASNVAGMDPSPYLNPVGVNPSNRCAVTPQNQVSGYSECVSTTAVGAQRIAAPPPRSLRDNVASLLDFSSWDALLQSLHPSVGIGLRYATPIGPIRLDLGLRLADLGCARARRDVTTQNRAVASGDPSYYIVSQPRCDFLFWDSVPATIHFSIGEAY
jgi:outer membrane protein assembly factor BamA